jgi:hypothetical protein
MEDANVTFFIPLLLGKTDALDVLTSIPAGGRLSLKTASEILRLPTLDTFTTTRRCWPKLRVVDFRALLGHVMGVVSRAAMEWVAITRLRKTRHVKVNARSIFRSSTQGEAFLRVIILCHGVLPLFNYGSVLEIIL